MATLGIVGFGSFGRFMAQHLRPFFDISVYDRVDVAAVAEAAGVRSVPLAEVLGSEIVVLAVPVQELAEVLRQAAGQIASSTLVCDVGSVKVKPMALMAEHLAPGIEVVGTHPMFGPQSGRDGIEGLKIVLCPLRTTRLESIRGFLADQLKLQVLEMEPEHHDHEMAYIQGLTHWMAKALRELKVPDLDLSTPAYRHLLTIEEILREDSLELFLTVERENPYAARARKELLRKLREIEEVIERG